MADKTDVAKWKLSLSLACMDIHTILNHKASAWLNKTRKKLKGRA